MVKLPPTRPRSFIKIVMKIGKFPPDLKVGVGQENHTISMGKLSQARNPRQNMVCAA